MVRRVEEVNQAANAQLAVAAATADGVLDDSYVELPSTSASNPLSTKPLRLRGKVMVMTRDVSVALDRTNTSDKNASHIYSGKASSNLISHNVDGLIISPSPIRRARVKHRECFAAKEKASFDPTVPLILPWDGKTMDDYTGPNRDKFVR